MRRLLVLVPLALLSAGCPDDPAHGFTLSAGDAAAFCRSTVVVYGEKFVACNQITRAAADVIIGSSAGTCAALLASVAAGRVVYDPDAGAACLAALTATSCADHDAEIEPDCPPPYAGTVADGGACTLWNDCAGGWCDTGAACPGLCVAWSGEGGPCAPGECGAGLACGPGRTCLAESPRGSDEAPCGTGSPECEAGLYCDWTTDICRRQGGVGDPCTYPDQCSVGLGCAASDTCRAYLAAGSSCASPDAACIGGTTCEGTTCRPWPTAGQPCGATMPCLGSFCDAGTCKAYTPNGATCTSDRECGFDASCAGTCEPDVCG